MMLRNLTLASLAACATALQAAGHRFP